MDDTLGFGEWLRGRRRALDLSQAALAARAGCAAVTIRKIEAGELRPSRPLAESLARQIGIAPVEHDAFVAFARGQRSLPPLPTPLAPAPRPWREPAWPGSLPATSSRLIGREADLQAIEGMLGGGLTRLLTLSGPGGVGKTRLALQAAGNLAGAFADGVCFVDLAPVDDPRLVLVRIAQALGLREGAGGPILDQIVAHLSGKQVLLLLDNFEQIMPAAHQVGELLAGSPSLRVLVTSREVLRIHGEQRYPVRPLGLPRERPLPLEAMSQYPAVRLFVERAAEVAPGFVLTDANVAAVDEICTRLDGLPLAIELAAARMDVLAVEQIAARLGQRFRLLTHGPRAVDPRHRTLGAAIDWSHDLLGEPERVALRRLAVFAGGFDLLAAEAVYGPGEADALDYLQCLVEKSLVVAEPADPGGMRYWLLETIRQYALEKLEAAGETVAVRDRHLAYYLGLLESAELCGPAQVDWLDRLEREQDNLLAAAAWSLERLSGNGVALQLLAALPWFIRLCRQSVSVWSGFAEAALATAPSDTRSAARCWALLSAGVIALHQGDLGLTWRCGEEMVSIGDAIGDSGGVAFGLNLQGLAAVEEGRHDCARTLYTRSLAIRRTLGDTWGIAQSLNNLGSLAIDDDGALAESLLSEALAAARQTGDPRLIEIALDSLAENALRQGDHAKARLYVEQSLRWCRETADVYIGRSALALAARLAMAEAHDELAARLYGAAQRAGEVWSQSGPSHLSALIEVLATRLGPARAAAAGAAGRSMKLKDAIDEALSWLQR